LSRCGFTCVTQPRQLILVLKAYFIIRYLKNQGMVEKAAVRIMPNRYPVITHLREP
jgi:hypothetical protein